MTDCVIETERLWLRKMDERDIDWFYRLNADEDVMRYTGEPIYDREQAFNVLKERPIRDYALYGYGRWACVLKSSNEAIGWCGLKYLDDLDEVDVGYRFFSQFWGSGLGTEASCACVEYGFKELGLKRIIGMAMPENIASVRVLEKSGLTLEGPMNYDGFDVVLYSAER